MKKLLLIAALAIVAAAPAAADIVAPGCNGLTLDRLTDFSLGELFVPQCTVGDKAFSAFLWSSNVVSASSVTVTGLDTPSNNPGLRFTGSFGPLAGDPAITFELGYTVFVSDPNWLIRGGSLSFAGGTNFNGGSGSIEGYEEWCAADFAPCLSGQLVHQDVLLSGSSGSATYTASFAPSVDFVDVYKTFTISGDPLLDTVVTQFDQRFDQVSTTPEPVTMILLGSGLLALAALRRRR